MDCTNSVISSIFLPTFSIYVQTNLEYPSLHQMKRRFCPPKGPNYGQRGFKNQHRHYCPCASEELPILEGGDEPHRQWVWVFHLQCVLVRA